MLHLKKAFASSQKLQITSNDPDTGRIFSPPFQSEVQSKQVINPELLNALEHDVKHILLFATLIKFSSKS